MRRALLSLVPLSLALGCQAGPAVVDADPVQREALLGVVRGLEGAWQTDGPEGEPSVVEFHVSSGGSAVREVMFPGSDHEMTNMYTLDGNALLMTHYCAGGNQPHMRAKVLDGNHIVFETAGVSDLKSADEVYMGEMTLVVIDENHIEQHWAALKGGVKDHENVMTLTRL